MLCSASLTSCSLRSLYNTNVRTLSPRRVPLQQHQQWRPVPCVRPPTAARRRQVWVAAARDPYEVLGVPRTADVSDIKKAFRKRALKLHPDVNKAPDARERFMEAKQAYEQLLDLKEGRASSSSSSRAGSAGAGARGSSAGAGNWGGYGQASSSTGYRSAQYKPPEPEYSFGDMLRDLEKELSGYAAQQQGKRGAPGRSGAPKSLWEELTDIGEEFVEFLEQNLGVSEDEAASYASFKQQYGEPKGSGSSGGGAASSTGPTMSSAFGGGSAGGTSGAGSGTRASASGSSSGGGSSTSGRSSGAAGSGRAPPPPERKSTAEYVEDELAALKKKLGM